MKTTLIEDSENVQKRYDTLLLEAKHLGIFSSELAMKIIGELARQPLCAMDIAKKLNQNEQKIYYHIRKMNKAGIIKLAGIEPRYGMSAKMFELVSPTIATKLYERAYEVRPQSAARNPDLEGFLKPFVANGVLNARIIIGDPYPHGRFDVGARDGAHVFDLAMLLGKFTNNYRGMNYKFDTQADSGDLRENLILFGEPKVNTILDDINDKLPVYFDYEHGYKIMSRATNDVYDAPRIGIILKMTNPWNKNRKLLVISGIGIRGVKASVVAIAKNISSVVEGGKQNIARVVEGLDKNGDGVIDDVRFLE